MNPTEPVTHQGSGDADVSGSLKEPDPLPEQEIDEGGLALIRACAVGDAGPKSAAYPQFVVEVSNRVIDLSIALPAGAVEAKHAGPGDLR